MAYRIFSLTTRGIEHISADEVEALPGCTVDTVGYRRISVSCADVKPLLALRTVDDVFLQLAEWDDIDHTRAALRQMTHFSARLGLEEAAAVCASLRPIQSPPTFSITASFVGKRNYSAPEIKQACARGIEASRHWHYLEDERESDLNIRIFIEHNRVWVGVRLAKRPLHERPYKQTHLPGSLKPPVAAAMLKLAGLQPGTRVLDPMCGAGTILIEAAAVGAVCVGGDIDAETVKAARLNAESAAIDLYNWDAQKLPLADASVDRVVCNLPWGRQITVDETLTQLYERVCGEIERVLVADGRAVLLTSTPEFVKFNHLPLDEQIEISVFGQNPVVMVFKPEKSLSH
jgi:tRNA (guanine6-N2)-methyltransferase